MANKKTKEDYQWIMENMEGVLDILEECVEKTDEGIEKLRAASQGASDLRDELEEIREKVKDAWRSL